MFGNEFANIKKSKKCDYITVFELEEIFQNVKNHDADIVIPFKQKLGVLLRNDVLAIDGFGSNDAKYDEFFNLNFQKFFDQKPSNLNLILISNLNGDNLRKKIGEKNFSRIIEKLKVIKFLDIDFRKRNLDKINYLI